ncbi:MAG: lasso peptide biosynthesis B2 protein [Elsteraceae bacterium]
MKAIILQAEAALALILALPLVYLPPLRRLRDQLGGFSLPLSGGQDFPKELTRARAVAGRLTRVANRLPWTSSCLVRATAGLMLLARRRIVGGRIRLGVRIRDGQLEAHAWLLLGSDILMGEGEAHTFTPIADFNP